MGVGLIEIILGGVCCLVPVIAVIAVVIIANVRRKG
jgi:hypothetical protein